MLRDRVLTALILAPLLLWVVLWAPSFATDSVIALVILLGAWEWSRFCGAVRALPRIAYVLVVAIAMAAVWYIGESGDGLARVLTIALLWWCVALAWIVAGAARAHWLIVATAGVLVLAPTWIALSRLRDTSERGPLLLLFLLALIFAADVGAYFAGRKFGRLKLAPTVSPGKTWEGVIGGFLGAGVVAATGGFWLGLPLLGLVGLCAAVVAFSIVGDLTESMFKRHVGLKDSGSLLPGHGGMLDRIDSITAAAPIFALGMIWMGVVA